MPDIIKEIISKQWDLRKIIRDLENSEWRLVEPGVYERSVYIATEDEIERLASETLSKYDWDEAVKKGYDYLIVNNYVDALREALSETAGYKIYIGIGLPRPGVTVRQIRRTY